MRKMLEQYYFRNLSTPLLTIPFLALFYIGIFLLFEQSSFAFSSSLIVSVIIITLRFLQFYRNHENMFSVMPISKYELVQTKFIFLLKVTAIYGIIFLTLYIFLIHLEEGWTWSSWISMTGMVFFLSLIIVNLLLFIDHLPNRKAASVIMPLLAYGLIYALFISPFHALRFGGIIFDGTMLAIAFGTIVLITWLNYRVVIHFVSKTDIS